jgi:EmrB/QacA subfamily drug resistance transporter
LNWTLALTSAAFFMVNLDALVVITALPAIRRELGVGLATLQWTVNAYVLAYAAGITTAAAAGDRFGRRRVFVAGLVLFAAASAACALAPSSALLLAARTVQGLAAAMVMPLSLTILTAAFPPERRGATVGLWGGIAGLAVALGPLVGGAVTQGLGWHWIFWVNVPIGLAAAGLAAARLTETFGPPTRLDLPAVVLVSGGAVGIVLGMVRAGELGWTSPQTLVTLGAGALLLVAFVLWEARAPEPMLPMRLFGNGAFSAANATGFLMAGSLNAAAFLVAQYFQLARGASPLGAGLRVLPWTVTPLVIAPLAGALSDRIGQRPLMVVGMVLQGAGLIWFARLAGPGFDYAQAVVGLVLAGVGVSMVLPATPTAALGAVARPDMGKASGVLSTLQRFGAAFGVALAATIFAASGDLGTPAAFTAGFRPALVAVAALSFVGALTALAVRAGGAPAKRRAGQPGAGAPGAAGPAPTEAVLRAGEVA